MDSLANKVLRMKLWDDESGGRVSVQFCRYEYIVDEESLVETQCNRNRRRSVVRCVLFSKLSLMSESAFNTSTVSQFTLLARTKKGTKPDFHGAANPEEASRLYHYFVQKVKQGYQEDRVKDGKFQAMMEVALVNDGPVSNYNYANWCTNLLAY